MWSRGRVSAIAVAAMIAAGVLAGLTVALTLGPRDASHDGTSSSTSASPSSTLPSSPTSEIPTPSASGSIAREGWTPIQVADSNNYAKIVGVEEGLGFVLAFGQADIHRLGVWRSTDGQSWQAGSLPELAAEFGGRLVDIATTPDGFVGVAWLGMPQGSEVITSAVYTSADGLEWKLAQNPVDGNWIGSAVAALGSRIVAGGPSGIFVSDDAGNTWEQTADGSALGGEVTDLMANGKVLVAVGYSGTLAGDNKPLLWTSLDDGKTWDRTELAEEGTASHLVAGAGEAILVFGRLGEDAVVWQLADGGWSADPIAICCLRGATATSTGYVVVGVPWSGGPGYVATSADAQGWTLEPLDDREVTGIGWSEVLGLLTTTRTAVVLGPTPYP